MAKLQGVKSIDMQDGKITKVSYQGEEYTKVDGVEEPFDGDIALNNQKSSSYTVGEFYELKSGLSAFGSFITKSDDNGSSSNGKRGTYFTVFRKSPAAVSAPFAEMITTKIDAVGARVAALEGEKDPTPTFNEGDRVKALRDGEYGDVLSGEYGEVKFTCADAAVDPYHIRVATDEGADYFRPQDLELVPEEVAKPIVGDIVVITGNTNRSRNIVGDIGKFYDDFGNDSESVMVGVPNRPDVVGTSGNYTKFTEMRPATITEVERYYEAVEKAKQAAKDAVFTKAGRKPNEMRKGDIIRITSLMPLMGTLKVGDITEIIEDSTTDRRMGIEIVCFAEDRKDNSKGGR